MQGLKVGGLVVFVDALGAQHNALVTAIWGDPEKVPCINVVFVGAEELVDNYGRQIKRNTSLVHKSQQPAHGNYYMMPGDTPNARA